MHTENDITGNRNGHTPKLKEWQAASHILTRASALIQVRGWQQGSDVSIDQECLATAMEHAFQENKYSIVDFNYAREAISQIIKTPREPISGNDDEIPYWGKHLMEWNDAPGRTQEPVVKALQSAAIFSMKNPINKEFPASN